MIRTVTIFIIISFLLSIIAYFLVINTTPLNVDAIEAVIEREQIEADDEDALWEFLDQEIQEGYIFEYIANEVFIVASLLTASIIFILSSIHLIIDKLFFKKFFESPSLWNAIRRSSLFTIGILAGSILYLINAEWYISIVVPLLLLLLEILYSGMRKTKPRDRQASSEDSEPLR